MNLTNVEKIEKFDELISQIKTLKSYRASLQAIINEGSAVYKKVWEYGKGYNVVLRKMPPEKITGISKEIERTGLVISFFETILYGNEYNQSIESDESCTEKLIERTVPYNENDADSANNSENKEQD